MRRKEREVTDLNQIREILEGCDVCRLGISTGGEPYVVPMNFGYRLGGDGSLVLYFHGAGEGRRLELLAQNPLVGFEMDCAHELVTALEACGYTMRFASIIGAGNAEILRDEAEKREALTVLMENVAGGKRFEAFHPGALEKTAVIRVTVNEYHAKKNGG